VAIIEEPPVVGKRQQLYFFDVLLDHTRNISAVRTIKPAEWKPMAKAGSWKSPWTKEQKHTIHEVDAYNMLRWCLIDLYHKNILRTAWTI